MHKEIQVMEKKTEVIGNGALEKFREYLMEKELSADDEKIYS